MDIKYKDKDVEISIKNVNKNAILTNEELNSVIKIIELFKDYDGSIKSSLDNIVKNDMKKESKKVQQQDDRPVIRDRLPNQIDMSELDIKKAITNHPMIRCPHCGQSSKAIVHIGPSEYYYIRKDNKEFNIIMKLNDYEEINNVCLPKESDVTTYHNDIENIKVPNKYKNVDLNVNENTVFECPICRQKESFNQWNMAFETPLNFFETDKLCEICGGEMVNVLVTDENGNKNVNQEQCEACGNKKSNVE